MDVSHAIDLGLGRAAYMDNPDPGETVFGFLCEDPRGYQVFDARAVFLARQIRDHRLSSGPVIAGLASPQHDPVLLCDILGLLGEREVLLSQVRQGPFWDEALRALGSSVSGASVSGASVIGDDVREAATVRMLADDRGLPWSWEPWTTWALDDPRVAAVVSPRSAPARPFTGLPMRQLIERLLDAAEPGPLRAELRRRPADPLLLQYIEHPRADRLRAAIERLDPALVLPFARRSADRPYLAQHGEEQDLPALADALRELDDCGFDLYLDGLVRIGGDEAAQIAEPYVRRQWFNPHTYERAAVLRANIAFPHEHLQRRLVEGLRDCEEDVRLLSIGHVPLDAFTREQLAYLAADPFETPQVRSAAADAVELPER